MLEYKTGLRCEGCGAPVPGTSVPLGGCLCDECQDAILDTELVRIEAEPSGQAFLEECPGCTRGGCGSPTPTPTEQRLERWTSALAPAPF